MNWNYEVWPHGEFPLMTVGRITLDHNPKDYFAEIEQIAFDPAHMVPGIEPSPDKMLQVGSSRRVLSLVFKRS